MPRLAIAGFHDVLNVSYLATSAVAFNAAAKLYDAARASGFAQNVRTNPPLSTSRQRRTPPLKSLENLLVKAGEPGGNRSYKPQIKSRPSGRRRSNS